MTEVKTDLKTTPEDQSIPIVQPSADAEKSGTASEVQPDDDKKDEPSVTIKTAESAETPAEVKKTPSTGEIKGDEEAPKPDGSPKTDEPVKKELTEVKSEEGSKTLIEEKPLIAPPQVPEKISFFAKIKNSLGSFFKKLLSLITFGRYKGKK